MRFLTLAFAICTALSATPITYTAEVDLTGLDRLTRQLYGQPVNPESHVVIVLGAGTNAVTWLESLDGSERTPEFAMQEFPIFRNGVNIGLGQLGRIGQGSAAVYKGGLLARLFFRIEQGPFPAGYDLLGVSAIHRFQPDGTISGGTDRNWTRLEPEPPPVPEPATFLTALLLVPLVARRRR